MAAPAPSPPASTVLADDGAATGIGTGEGEPGDGDSGEKGPDPSQQRLNALLAKPVSAIHNAALNSLEVRVWTQTCDASMVVVLHSRRAQRSRETWSCLGDDRRVSHCSMTTCVAVLPK